jgi:hypothetical protein
MVGRLKRRSFNKRQILDQVRSLTWNEHLFGLVNIPATLGYVIPRLILRESVHPLFGFPDVLDCKEALCQFACVALSMVICPQIKTHGIVAG